ncbi:MAG: LCP family protein [Thermoleophilia bacterium]|nr:LCP family protein [Thermoleophilia bacterium]
MSNDLPPHPDDDEIAEVLASGDDSDAAPVTKKSAWYRVPRRRRRWPWFAMWVALLIVGVGGGLAVASIQLLDNTLTEASPNTPDVLQAEKAVDAQLPGAPINILLLGSDKRAGQRGSGDPGRADSIILIRMDNDQGFISMLSFPRDLYVNIPGHGMNKINASFAFGGPAKAIETVKAFTGQPINYFVNIDFTGFIKLVDQVGGVYLDVDRKYFNKNTPGAAGSYSEIDLKPGYQRMNGKDALSYVRYRHTDSDFARIARQQAFLSELKRQTNRFGNLPEIPSYAGIFARNITTNIKSVPVLLGIMEQAITTDKDRIARAAITGNLAMRGGASVVEAPASEVSSKVDQWLHPSFTQGTGAAVVSPNEVAVDVLNGNGALLSAEDAAQQLRDKGWNATSGGNAEAFGKSETVVLYADGKRDAAQAISKLFGPKTNIGALPKSEQSKDVDLRVVLGESYDGQLATAAKPSKAKAARPQANAVWTTSLVPLLSRVQKATGLKVMVPLRVPSGSSLRIVRSYRVNTGGQGPQALKMVFRVPSGTYWGYQILDWSDPPLLDGRTGVVNSGGREYSTFYDGKNLMRLAWQKDGVTYWISNTLDYQLSPETMYAIAKSARPLGRANLPKGKTSTSISMEQDAYTP